MSEETKSQAFETRQVTVAGITFPLGPTPGYRLAKMRAVFREKGVESEEGYLAVNEAIFWGARRAGAQITLEWLHDNLDVHTSAPAIQAFRELNLMVDTAGDQPGEATATSPP